MGSGPASVDAGGASDAATVPKKATPLPWMAVLTCGFILASNYVSMVMVFPLIPFMVADFFPEMAKEELGYKVGFLGSVYFIGTFCASIIFGWLADVYGRKITMMLGIIGTICAILLFGMSETFYVALIARFLWGLLNGNLGVVKTTLTELCDDSNQAAAFAILGVNGGVSRSIGPSIGSFLSQPALKYESFKGGIFDSYPYLLPCLVCVGIGLVSLIMIVYFLPETLNAKNSAKGPTGSSYSKVEPITPKHDSAEPDSDDDDDDDDDADVESAAVLTGPKGVSKAKISGFARLREVVCTRNIMICTTLYAVVGMIGIVVDEIFPLWTLTPPESGGFNFTSSDIGL